MRYQLYFELSDPSQVGEVRRAASAIAADLKFDEVRTGKVAIVISELATNIIKHAQSGEIILLIRENSMDILALDKGPGIQNIDLSFIDGTSTTGTSGNGLGAIKRLSDSYDIFSIPGKGTAVLSTFGRESSISGLSIPLKGEEVCGDSWSYSENESQLMIMVADGLGHGILAHGASSLAVETFEKYRNENEIDLMNLLHGSLRSTRGAAISLARVDYASHTTHYCGVGNIGGVFISPGNTKRAISFSGTAGVQVRKVQSLSYQSDKDSLVIMFSDGLSSHWNIFDYPGLYFKSPALIAGILYRDFTRRNDDVTVVVARVKA